MKKPQINIDEALEEFDIEETEKSLAEQYGKLFGCPCEVQIHGVTSDGEDDLGQRIRIEHSVRLLD